MYVIEYRQGIDYNKEIEANVLSVMLSESSAFASIYGMIEKDCFYDSDYKLVYENIENVWANGNLVEVYTISNAITSKGVLELKGVPTSEFLEEISHATAPKALLMQWAIILREKYARRLMKQLTTQGITNEDVFEEADKLQEKLRRVLDIKQESRWKPSADAIKKFFENREIYLNGGDIGCSTSFPTLDKINGGLRNGHLVIIAARSSVGKSALAGNIALHNAIKGKSVGFISLEMPAHEIITRLSSAHCGVSYSKMERRVLPEDENVKMIKSMSYISGLKIFFSDSTDMNIMDIRVRAQQLQQMHGIQLLIVDYLQLVQESSLDKNRSRDQALGRISNGLKKLAMHLDIPVIALAQLNKESEKRTNKKPIQSDLRESGNIEQDADVIMLLHRNWRVGIKKDEKGESTENQADLIIPKWRNGSPIELKLRFEGKTMKFTEPDVFDNNITEEPPF